MNGKKSKEKQKPRKPVNINIYYNINSTQMLPASARIARCEVEQDEKQNRLEAKLKANVAPRRKKLSMDLSNPTLQKKANRANRKSNNSSICSGYPSSFNRNADKFIEKKSAKDLGIVQKEKKLTKLLENFSGGEIDKAKLTKEILNIFDFNPKQSEQSKKHTKKKPSQSTLLQTATPRNTLLKLNSTANNIKSGTQKTRKKLSKSARASYQNSKSFLVCNALVDIKGIDSSLFLPQKQEEKQIVERINQVYTSNSVIMLNENIKSERESFVVSKNKLPKCSPYVQLMAIRIQRAWRKYKTKQLIVEILHRQQLLLLANRQNSSSFIDKIQCDSDLSLQNFLSQQLCKGKAVSQTERTKGEILRRHEISKWGQIMKYVQSNMNDKELSSDQCLNKIIEYFQSVKKEMESELLPENANKTSKIQSKTSKEMTEFTNKAISRQLLDDDEFKAKVDLDVQISAKIKKYDQSESDDESERLQESQESVQRQERVASSSSSLVDLPAQNKIPMMASLHDTVALSKKGKQFGSGELLKFFNTPNFMSFETINHSLMNYSKKLQWQHEEQLNEITISDPEFQSKKKAIDSKYTQQKQQLQKILKNLNRGYEDAKSILQKQIMLSEDAGSKSTISKCKSDNYLLKTAINYKQYVEKKQCKSPKNKSNQSENSQKKDCNIRKIQGYSDINAELEDDDELLINAASLEFNENQRIGFKNSEKATQQESHDVKLKRAEGKINFKLQQTIMSAEFLQYEELQKKFDEEPEQQFEVKQAEVVSLFDNTRLNQNNKKLKYLTLDDKEDIFEFIFIDLSLELINEYDQGSKLFRTIKKYMEKRSKLDSIPKGVKTNLLSCKEYLREVEKFVESNFKGLFQKHIRVPMGPTAIQMLKYMHDNDASDEDPENQNADESVPLILPVIVFEKFQSSLKCEYPRFYEDDAKEASRIKFLKSVDHIHHKAIFDCLNEWLDTERPFGIWGKPFPWKTTFKKSINNSWNEPVKNNKLKLGVEKVVECCSYLCGILVDKEESLFLNHKVSEQYIEQIQEDRMSKMLSNQLLENEDRWMFYDDEETEVLMELTKFIANEIVNQLVFDLAYLGAEQFDL